MRVLVTRPASSSARTGEKLRARGHEPIVMPLTKAVHDTDVTLAAVTAPWSAMAVTSGEAIRALGQLDPAALKPHLQRPLFAVGRATADEAAAAGFTNILHADGDGARLADLIVSERSRLGALPLAYLAGKPRAAGLERSLATSGVAFQTFECYRMESVEPQDAELRENLQHNPVDAILFYSRHNAELFFNLDIVRRHQELIATTHLLCLSAAIADIIPNALRPVVEIAAAPDEESLLSLLNVGKCPIFI